MIIKKLIIHNIASIADAEIDFQGEALGMASVFLISGETGAGKSTILDSISLALYGQTPRMMSSSREELSLSIDNKTKFYTNDNAQLLKRGTGEGYVKLTFEGNDRKEYEAIWVVQRDYKKPDKKLQKPSRSLVSLGDSTYAETHKKRIDEKIIELTGLDYEQFCRTVMLAQGEFTKFLKSNRTDKSQILEKLTGTQIYSEIGKEIAAKYLNIKREWEELKNALDSIEILSEKELDSINLQLTSLAENIEINKMKRDSSDSKFKWLLEFNKLNAKIREKESLVVKIKSVIQSEAFKADQQLVEEYNLTVMPRTLSRELKIKEKEIVEGELRLKHILGEILIQHGKQTEAKQDVADLETKIKSKVIENESLNIEKINSDLEELSFQRDLSSGLSVALDKLNLVEKLLKDKRTENEELTNKGQALSSLSKLLHKEVANAKKEKETAQHNYDVLFASTTDAAKKLRSTIILGENCPVCGQRVVEKIDDQIFENIIQPFKTKKEEADARFIKVNSELLSTQRLIEDNLLIQKENRTILVKIEEEFNLLNKEIEEKKEKLPCRSTDKDSLSEALGLYLDQLKDKLEFLSSQQKTFQKISKEIALLQKTLQTKRNDFEKIDKEIIKLSEVRSTMEGSLAEKKRFVEETKNKLQEFLAEHPSIEIRRVEELDKIDSNQISTIEAEINKTESLLIKETGLLGSLKEENESMMTDKPLLREEDTLDRLKSEREEIDLRIGESQKRIGQLNERIEIHKRNSRLLKEKLEEEGERKVEKEKWEELYRLLGDTDGSKFRSVAQSFILKSLLDNANAYMETFTDRYSLTCNPGSLAILVSDRLRPSEPQPSSILSGGESFMASLSLALALSNLKGRGMNVDMLFIDEGFGTLSPEYLGNVMETLERLHRIGGKKVGLISHVPELKERIPVQINVIRESPTLSKIEISTN